MRPDRRTRTSPPAPGAPKARGLEPKKTAGPGRRKPREKHCPLDRQQIVDAFPDDAAPSYLLRDRDYAYGEQFRRRVKGMRIEEVLTAPQSPWQNPFAERLIGSVRRECLDHVVVLDERHLRRILTAYLAYYHRARTHLSLEKDAPVGRPIEPPPLGTVISIPEVGSLHHRYVRRAA